MVKARPFPFIAVPTEVVRPQNFNIEPKTGSIDNEDLS